MQKLLFILIALMIIILGCSLEEKRECYVIINDYAFISGGVVKINYTVINNTSNQQDLSFCFDVFINDTYVKSSEKITINNINSYTIEPYAYVLNAPSILLIRPYSKYVSITYIR